MIHKFNITALVLLLISSIGCNVSGVKKGRRVTMFIGVDVSGSYTRTKNFKDGIEFLGEYIYGHLNKKGDLSTPVDLYVGGIGGDVKEEPQDFFPIHDFIGLKPKAITDKLIKEFRYQKDNLTDFNQFFRRIKQFVKQKNLVLHPIEIVMVTDGVPEIQGKSKKAIVQGYQKIDLKSLENLSREINIRILYAHPKVGNNWRTYVPTKRVKVWTVEPRVMLGWHDQVTRLGSEGLWKWISDNIDPKISKH